MSPAHGRLLIYVWAIEQDQFSKRSFPTDRQEDALQEAKSRTGQDVFVPWVLPVEKLKSDRTTANPNEDPPVTSEFAEPAKPDIVNRYYHMFSQGELIDLVSGAATELGLKIGLPSLEGGVKTNGVTIVQNGWERSNYYVEVQCWER